MNSLDFLPNKYGCYQTIEASPVALGGCTSVFTAASTGAGPANNPFCAAGCVCADSPAEERAGSSASPRTPLRRFLACTFAPPCLGQGSGRSAGRAFAGACPGCLFRFPVFPASAAVLSGPGLAGCAVAAALALAVCAAAAAPAPAPSDLLWAAFLSRSSADMQAAGAALMPAPLPSLCLALSLPAAACLAPPFKAARLCASGSTGSGASAAPLPQLRPAASASPRPPSWGGSRPAASKARCLERCCTSATPGCSAVAVFAAAAAFGLNLFPRTIRDPGRRPPAAACCAPPAPSSAPLQGEQDQV